MKSRKTMFVLGAFLLVALIFMVLPVSAVVYSGGVIISPNKYVAIPSYVSPDYGTIHIFNLAFDGSYSKEAYAWETTPNDTVVLSNSTLDVMLDASGGAYVNVPGGLFKSGGIEYTVYLLDGNGGQPETRHVWVTNGYVSPAGFIGHAASGGSPSAPVAITSITYGGYFPVYGDSMGSEIIPVPTLSHGSHTITANVGSVMIDGLNIAPDPSNDPASGSVKIVTIAFNNGNVIKVAETDENNYFTPYGVNAGVTDIQTSATFTL